MLLTSRDQAVFVEELRAIREGVFDRVDIEVLIGDLTLVMAATNRIGRHRPGSLHHRDLINVMDAVVAEDPAARP